MVRQSLDGHVDSDADSPGEPTHSTADMFDVLNDVQRSHALRYLAETPVATLGELAEWIVGQENGTLEDAERIAIALHHGHLLKLAAAGLVDYDQETRTVETTADLRISGPVPPRGTRP